MFVACAPHGMRSEGSEAGAMDDRWRRPARCSDDGVGGPERYSGGERSHPPCVEQVMFCGRACCTHSWVASVYHTIRSRVTAGTRSEQSSQASEPAATLCVTYVCMDQHTHTHRDCSEPSAYAVAAGGGGVAEAR